MAKGMSLYACILVLYTRRKGWNQEQTLDKSGGQTMITANQYC